VRAVDAGIVELQHGRLHVGVAAAARGGRPQLLGLGGPRATSW
jgi:hypothetical protein